MDEEFRRDLEQGVYDEDGGWHEGGNHGAEKRGGHGGAIPVDALYGSNWSLSKWLKQGGSDGIINVWDQSPKRMPVN